MRFDRFKNPGACAAPEEARYAVHGVAVVKMPDGDYLAATDGRVLSLVKAELEGDDDPMAGPADRARSAHAYPPEAFDAARKAAKSARAQQARVTLNGTARVVDANGATVEHKASDTRFPDVLGVVPKGKPRAVLCVNAAYLAQLQEALGATAVRLEFHGEGTDKNPLDDAMPFVVRPIYLPQKDARGKVKSGPTAVDDGSFGVLMPISAS